MLLAIVAALALVLTLHAWLGDRPLAAGVLLLAWGLAYGGVSVALQLWMLRAAPDAVEPATAWFVSAFNLGIAAGSLLGVPTVDALGLRANLLLAASCLVPPSRRCCGRVAAGMPRARRLGDPPFPIIQPWRAGGPRAGTESLHVCHRQPGCSRGYRQGPPLRAALGSGRRGRRAHRAVP